MFETSYSIAALSFLLGGLGLLAGIVLARKSQSRLRRILSATTDGIWDWKIGADEVFWSARLYEILGFRFGSIKPTFETIIEFTHPEDREQHRGMLLRSIETGEPFSAEFRMRRSDGQFVWISTSGHVLEGKGGKARRIIGSISDITKRQENADQLLQAKRVAEEASSAKDRFLANISHELRTPLNGILGMTELVASEESLNAELREQVGVIQKSSHSLLRIVNDVLDLSSLESGKFTLRPEPFSLRSLLESTEKLFQVKAGRKKVFFRAMKDQDLPETVFGDEERIRQVLTNLLGNAVKFTPEKGKVTLKVRQVRHEGETGVEFEVEDNGPGIAEGKKDDIFSPFEQADTSLTRKYGGTGLGLAIVSGLVEQMGGKISLDTELGRGSSFRVFLPLLSHEGENVHPSLSDESPTFIESFEDSKCLEVDALNQPVLVRRALVVEDNRVNQEVASKMLRKIGVDSDVVSSGELAIEKLKDHSYDLVFMDLQMPGMDGLETTRVIRKNEGPIKQHPKIFAMTAHAYHDDKARCMGAGMDGYVSKPISLSELRKVVSDVWPEPSN